MSGLTDTFNALVDSLNVLGGGSKRGQEVRDAFARTHRTLQQQFVSVVVLPVLEQLAEANAQGRVDGRNQAAADLATKMLAGLSEDDKYLPLI